MTANEAGIIVLVLLAGAGVWTFALTTINRMAKLTRGLRAQRGEPMRSSSWGSASINGVNANGCAKIDEYNEGYLLRLMPIFGGGGIWFPKGSVQPGSALPGRAIAPGSLTMKSGEDIAVVYGHLAAFLERR